MVRLVIFGLVSALFVIGGNSRVSAAGWKRDSAATDIPPNLSNFNRPVRDVDGISPRGVRALGAATDIPPNLSNFNRPVRDVDGISPRGVRALGDDLTIDEAKDILQSKQALIETYIICDKACAYEFDYDKDKITKFINDVIDRMNEFLTPIDVSMSIVGIEAWSKINYLSFDPSVIGTSFNDRQRGVLDQLEAYRIGFVNDRINSDFILLLSGNKFSDMNGAAFSSAMCNSKRSVAFAGFSNYYASTTIEMVAQTALHEMGHALGMSHDTADCNCDLGYGNCTMSPSQNLAQVDNPTYSDCSLKSLAGYLKTGDIDCLIQDAEIKDSFCGNGQVDDGEDCDCGTLGGLEDCECCDHKTCKFVEAGNSCQANDCQTCSGDSEDCSGEDMEEFTSCDDKRGYCYGNTCQSPDRSCKRLYGPNAYANKQAMAYNKAYHYAEHNGGGFMLYDPNIRSWSRFKEFVEANGDGNCGCLECVTTKTNAHIIGESAQTLITVTFRLKWSSFTKITYIFMKDTLWGSYKYKSYYPITASMGSPCKTGDNKAGYCNNSNKKMDKYDWVPFFYATCDPIPDPNA